MFKIKSHFLSLLLITALSSQLFSCGYLLHSERRGQKSTANLDWPIVGLDAIGLLFFIIPGVIAFAVDFSSGTIYLPGGQHSFSDKVDVHGSMKIKFDPTNFDKEKIAALIQEQTKVAVNFDDPKLQVYKE